MNSLVKSFTYWDEEIKSALIYPCNFERFRNRILYINTRNEKGLALSSVHVLSRSA